MEHDEIDKLFRKALEKETPQEGAAAQEKVWQQLDINKSKPVPFGLLALLLLLLLCFGAAVYAFLKNKDTEQKNEQLQIELIQIKAAKSKMEEKVADLTQAVSNIQTVSAVTKKVDTAYVEKYITVEPEVIEKEVRVWDTIFMEKTIEPIPEIVYQTDTIYLDNNSLIAKEEEEKMEEKTELKKPQSVEFVFDEKATKNQKKKKNKELFIMQSGKSELSDENRKDLNVIKF